MVTQKQNQITLDNSETRTDEMEQLLTGWVDDLVALTNEARKSEEFQKWLDAQSRFHDYSYRNTLLIKRQQPNATKVAGYNTWRTEFDRHVQEGEQAIWIWAPIISKRCPECENSPSYHEQSDCEYDETPPEDWSKGLVGFTPTAVFDISQTDGEPLPELKTAAGGDATDLLPDLIAAADSLGVDVSVVPPSQWEHGNVKGTCTQRNSDTYQSCVEVKARPNHADLAVTVIHEYAHALLHVGTGDTMERTKREVEAEAVAYIVGRYFDLNTSGSAFYLAAWQDDEPEMIKSRLGRISNTAGEIIDVVN